MSAACRCLLGVLIFGAAGPEFHVVIPKISAFSFYRGPRRRRRAAAFSFSEFVLMRGATLFFSALLVVVGTDGCVCLKRNSNKGLIVDQEPVASDTAAWKRPYYANSTALVPH